MGTHGNERTRDKRPSVESPRSVRLNTHRAQLAVTRHRTKKADKGSGKGTLSYRLPWSAVPGGGAYAGLQVALLHVQRLVQDVAIVVIEPLAAGPLAHHQTGSPAFSAALSALEGASEMHFRDLAVP